jgi:nucleotide-binding universal stress UspA family protein
MIRIQKILCPVDFFPASERAADYATALAENYGAQLTLLHVVSPIIGAAYEVPLNVEEIIANMTESANVELARIADRVKQRGVRVEPIVRPGDIDFEIQDYVAKYKPDLVVMGTHGRKSFDRWFMGSHTERLLRQLPTPILTIGPGKKRIAPPEIRRILVTTDFSDGTPDAVAYAFSIAQECQSKVTLLHVLNEVSVNFAERYRAPLIRSLQAELEKLVPEEAGNWCEVSTRVESGLPLTAILKNVKRENVDLVVMNIHGKGMLDRALLGSTAERVVRGAGIPVLLIPPIPAGKRKRRVARKVA